MTLDDTRSPHPVLRRADTLVALTTVALVRELDRASAARTHAG